MKKIIVAMFVFMLSVLFITGCGEKETEKPINNEVNNNEIDNNEQIELDENYKTVSLLLSDEDTKTIKITYSTERFFVEDALAMEPQSIMYFIDKNNGNDYNVYVDMSTLTVKEYYNKLVNTAKNNAKSDNFEATELEDVTYGGIKFKKFSVSWSKAYEYINKDTGELESGVSHNNETAIFAELQPGFYLRYEGLTDEETLEDLFVKIKK